MVSKLFVTVFVFMTVVGVSFSVTQGDDAVKLEEKNVNQTPGSRDEVKKFFSMMEKIDIDQILNNDRLMSNNVKCFLNEGPCSAQLREMKKIVPMIIKDSCSSCTKEQKNMIKKTIDAIKARRPNEYERISKFFDADGKYNNKFLENLDKSK